MKDVIYCRFTLLCGRPPFETSSLKETYSKIKKNDFSIPSHRNLSSAACDMIYKMLKSDPNSRPTMAALLSDPWLKEGRLFYYLRDKKYVVVQI